MADRPSHEERLAQDTHRRHMAMIITLCLAVAIGLAAWGSTMFHPAGL